MTKVGEMAKVVNIFFEKSGPIGDIKFLIKIVTYLYQSTPKKVYKAVQSVIINKITITRQFGLIQSSELA